MQTGQTNASGFVLQHQRTVTCLAHQEPLLSCEDLQGRSQPGHVRTHRKKEKYAFHGHTHVTPSSNMGKLTCLMFAQSKRSTVMKRSESATPKALHASRNHLANELWGSNSKPNIFHLLERHARVRMELGHDARLDCIHEPAQHLHVRTSNP